MRKKEGEFKLPPYILELLNLNKSYDDHSVIDGISLQVGLGEFLTLLGPSGCGKTTTLRLLAGFEQPDEGEIRMEEKDITHLPAYKRDVNTVFQSYALFPHMNVFDNIAFGLKMKKVLKSELQQRVADMLSVVQMSEYAKRKPEQLSGGQKQRVAIARALVNQPKILLLDEPLGALDLKLRKQMQGELKHLQQKLGITFIYVTHDQEEALTMSDRIAAMNQGRIEQIGTPEEIYKRPKSRFVANFIGEANLLEAHIESLEKETMRIKWLDYQFSLSRYPSCKEKSLVHLAIRPENLRLCPRSEETSPLISATFQERTYAGAFYKTIVSVQGTELVVHETPEDVISATKGDRVYLSWSPHNLMVVES